MTAPRQFQRIKRVLPAPGTLLILTACEQPPWEQHAGHAAVTPSIAENVTLHLNYARHLPANKGYGNGRRG